MILSAQHILAYRMTNLLLGSREDRSPADVVTWMGAMQAQDLASGEWSFGVRCAGTTQVDIHQATVDRHILRTWPMRGTVHFIPPADAKWMLELTGVRAVAGAAGRRARLGLTDKVVESAVELLASSLSGGRSLTRGECVALLTDAGLHTAPEHGYHLLWYASQIGVTCIGPQVGKEQTFVLLNDWVPTPNRPSREEALATLAVRYFQSHGPTTRQDFVGWTGLAVGDAKQGIELAGAQLVEVETIGGPMIFSAGSLDRQPAGSTSTNGLLLLPGFDEYLLGYKDRSAMISAEHMNHVVPGGNGVFRPTIVEKGRVLGTWKREVKKRHVNIQAMPFEPMTSKQHKAFAVASAQYARYLQLDLNLSS